MTAIPASHSPSTTQSKTSKIESEMFFVNDTALGTTAGNVIVDVTLPSAPTGGIESSCTSFFGLAQSAPETAGTAYSGNNLAQPLTLAAGTAGDLIVDSFGGGFNLASTGKSASPIAGQTQLTNAQLVAGGILSGSSYEVVPAPGSVTAEWSPVNVPRLAGDSFTVTAVLQNVVSPPISGTIAIGGTDPITFSCAGARPSAACTVTAGSSTLIGANQIPVTVSLTARNQSEIPAAASQQADGFHGAPGTYPVTVIASAGGVTQAISLILVVQ
ncbi:MAG TPA: hypothetical protein VLJ11_10645 [Bryobacteraceae bacterium]|nr:hypothetical protein [Bryobacteraceae bacterium]